jgi:RNA polymerase-binding transcription factor DksA
MPAKSSPKKAAKKAVPAKKTAPVKKAVKKAAPVKKVVKKAAPAKKAVKKAAPAKKAVKKAAPAKKAVKKAAPAKKAVKKAGPAKKEVKKAAPAKKAVKKAAPAKKAVKKAAPAKKPSPAKKILKKAVPAKKPAAPKKPAPKAPSPVKAPEKKAVVSKPVVRKSSLVSVPPPPAPKKPPFVPPKADPLPKAYANGGGSHSPAFIEKQRQRLLDLRDSLMDSMSGMTRDTIRNAPEGSEASGSGQHQGDAGSDAYDRDFALSVLAKEQDALYEIEQALRRIKGGTYGNCEISERKIPTARLEAIPFARLTVECQAQWEKEYGNRRFRPSNEVGFSGGVPQEDEDSVTVSLDEDDE